MVFRFAIAVYGCRANQAEADALRSALAAAGGRDVADDEVADVVVLNTCAVTAGAEAQSRNGVRRAWRAAPGALVVVTGCAAQRDPHGLAALEGVDLLAGNRAKAELPALLARLGDLGALGMGPGPARAAALDAALSDLGLVAGVEAGARVVWDPDPSQARVAGRVGPIPRVRTRAIVKIQDGCGFRCTYCIVSTLRGRPVSRDPDEVAVEVGRLVEAGLREIVLAGVNLGLYAPPAGGGLPELLERLARVPGIERIRLSSLEPMTITDALIDRMADLPLVARSLHVPLQSGDDEVLERMGRPYRAADLLDLFERIRTRLPLCGLGLDVVAGFPGESAAAFERTLRLIERLPATYLHAFAYSERPGTPAAALRPRVPNAERKARVHRLLELDRELRVGFQARLAGRACRLVIEGAEADRFHGMSGEYVRMAGEARGLQAGAWVTVRAGESRGPAMQHCRLLGEEG